MLLTDLHLNITFILFNTLPSPIFTVYLTLPFLVSMVPNLNQVYAGDTLKLTCNNKGSSVKWFFNNILSNNILSPEKELQMTAISAKNSGSYRCESNGQRSDNFNISVLGKYRRPALTYSLKYFMLNHLDHSSVSPLNCRLVFRLVLVYQST